jgi:hypothetical protein
MLTPNGVRIVKKNYEKEWDGSANVTRHFYKELGYSKRTKDNIKVNPYNHV